jgi:hypothetical protein
MYELGQNPFTASPNEVPILTLDRKRVSGRLGYLNAGK